ncbi:hypothetical protein DPMN_033673 [Dreissena polymorpha]|uniref:Uncharacterized protein n=1 Tax=Dreissena polymorpha TaxID=45954 RepID=A0A9D4M479_DREPO|nr:hypothetical protein DPMN_033673 [Dreissena polymorpha]
MIGSEEQAIKELLHDDDIAIRPVDKGSGIVIMDREDYVKKLKCEMSDSETYVEMTDGKQSEESGRYLIQEGVDRQ